MKITKLILLAACVGALSLCGCSKSDEDKAADKVDDAKEAVDEAADDAADAAKDIIGGDDK